LDRREILSHERGAIRKKWTSRVPVCVVFPNTYYVGMSNLAVHLLYRYLNSRDEVVCERAFFDGSGDALSLESGRPLSSFEIVFFTLSFEMDYPNIPRMLAAGSVPALSRQRGEGAPLVVGGGVCAMANPEPLSAFFDLFLLGDVESCLPPFIERYLETRGEKKQRVLEELGAWDWAYNPVKLDVSYKEDGTIAGFAPPSYRARIERFKGRNLATSAIISGETEFGETFLVEGSRGCPSACAFCLAGNIYPFTVDRLEGIDEGVADIGIIGGGVSFHPGLYGIVKKLKERGQNVHLPSLRLDEVSLEVVDLLKDSIKTLTFGIEAGSESLRKRIGKPLSDNEIFDRIEKIAELKSFNFKFYFMVGLPGEQRQDVQAIVEMIKHLLHVLVKKGSSKGRIGSITVHASPFVPKAATPFQWLPMEDMRELKAKIALLKRELGKVANTHFTHESLKYSFLQGVFARGDRRLKDVITELSEGTSLTTLMKESPVNLNFYVTRERDEEEIFPWDFIDDEPHKRLLRRKMETCLSRT
jgi:radical SAM superfamily enzyme YgiQ (UPF0313 family)